VVVAVAAVAEQRHANAIETGNWTGVVRTRLGIAILRVWLSGRVRVTGAVQTLHFHASRLSARVTDSVDASPIGAHPRPDISNANFLHLQLFTTLTSGTIPPYLA